MSYEYALRLPTSRELFGSGDDIERGNSNLKPESSNNVNISVTANAVDLTDHRLTIDAAFQYREIKDYIRRTTNNDSGRASSQNDGRVRNLGTDLSIRYTFKDAFFVGGNFSYGTAVGFMIALINFGMVYLANMVSRKVADYSLW